MHLSLKETGRVTVRGKLFQLYDHSTVIHAVRAHENRIEFYKSEKKLSDSVIQYLRL
jgi:chromosomal replication initiation ATPase DnaA